VEGGQLEQVPVHLLKHLHLALADLLVSYRPLLGTHLLELPDQRNAVVEFVEFCSQEEAGDGENFLFVDLEDLLVLEQDVQVHHPQVNGQDPLLQPLPNLKDPVHKCSSSFLHLEGESGEPALDRLVPVGRLLEPQVAVDLTGRHICEVLVLLLLEDFDRLDLFFILGKVFHVQDKGSTLLAVHFPQVLQVQPHFVFTLAITILGQSFVFLMTTITLEGFNGR